MRGIAAFRRVSLWLALASVALAPAAGFAQREEAAQRGNESYQYWCATCHGRGPGNPGTTALAAKYKGKLPGVLEDRTDLTPQAVRFAVRNGVSIMPPFRKTEVSDADLDAIAEYLVSGPASRTGDAKRP